MASTSMSHSSRIAGPMSYPDAVRVLAMDNDVQGDVNDACAKFSQAMTLMLDRFGLVAKQMHTIDMQRAAVAMKPRWDAIRKEFGELLWQYRTNAGLISGRLRLFCSAVLPVAARNTDGRSRRSYEETIQVLRSFMNISSEHAALTRSLAERALSLTKQMACFHTELAKFVSRQVCSGQKEIYDLSVKINELETLVRQVCVINAGLVHADVTHAVFSTFRIVASSGRRPGRSKIPNQRLLLPEDLSKVTVAYESLDTKHNEFAHAQYSAQICLPQNNFLATVQTTVAPLVCDALLSFASGLSLFLAIWTRLRDDCGDILQWIDHPASNSIPPVIRVYQETENSIYVALANALDACASGIDPAVIGRPN